MKIGPGRNSKSPSRWFQIDEPVTSEGIRSGVNWMRVKRMLSIPARTSARRASSRGRGSPRGAPCPSARKPSQTLAFRCRRRPLDLVENLRGQLPNLRAPSDAPRARRRPARGRAAGFPSRAGRRAVAGRRDELPGVVAEDRSRRVGCVRERDAAARARPGCEGAQAWHEAVVQIERACDRENGLVLDAVEAGGRSSSRGSCRRLVQRALVGIGPPKRGGGRR